MRFLRVFNTTEAHLDGGLTTARVRLQEMCETAARSARAAETPRPRWSLLYGLGALVLGLLTAVELAPLAGAIRGALRFGCGLGGFAGMAWWVRSNRVALDQRDWCECAAGKVTMRVIPSRRPAPAEEPAFARVEDDALLVGAGRR